MLTLVKAAHPPRIKYAPGVTICCCFNNIVVGMFLRARKTKREEKGRSDDPAFALVATERASPPFPPILVDNSGFFFFNSRRCFQFLVYCVLLFSSAISKSLDEKTIDIDTVGSAIF